MEELEQRVWSRVRGEEEATKDRDFRAALLESVAAEAEYQSMKRAGTGLPGELVSQLWKCEREIQHTLRGVWYLQTGEQFRCKKMPSEGKPGRKQLVRRYHISRRAITEWMARSAEPECGCVFRYLAQQQEQQCVRLAQLLGLTE